jgi:uncharacterized 2Fe-2S/4Fe-4S cluster protein (DUF4445 family)
MSKTPEDNEHTLILMPSGRRGQVPEGTTLLDAARSLGVEIESICGGRQTCAKCLVRIEQGEFDKHGINSDEGHATPIMEEERLLLDESGISPDLRLACAACIRGDLLVSVPEESRAQKQMIRKSATDRVIEVKPTVRQVYIEVKRAELGKHRGDWGRVQDALAEQWDLTGLEIDLHALRRLQGTLRRGKWALTVTIWDDERVIDLQPGYAEGAYGLAVDVGSTTIACYLCDLRTGDLLATEAMMNPQVSFGEDLMSRISYAANHPDGLEKMHSAVIDAINKLAIETTRAAGIARHSIYEIVLVGNTTMTHILLGISPEELGHSPFALANRSAMDFSARDLGLRLNPSANAHILPAQAGHVGADNVGVLLAEEPHLEDKIILTIDVGTNAEIVLSSREWMFSASSPTGPAFEGGQISSGMRAAPGAIERVRIDAETKEPRFRVIGEDRWSDEWQLDPGTTPQQQPRHLAAGICGSGIIEAVAELFLSGVISADGRFNPAIESERVRWGPDRKRAAYILATDRESSSGKAILITQQDVRNIQLAKGALYAGAKLLMMRAGVDKVDQITMAGAFGSYINPRHAMVLGLIPDCDLEHVHAVGNAAGDGARIALLNKEKRSLAEEISTRVRYIETAVDQDFQEEFVSAMHIPHQRDAFPHLEQVLSTVPEIEPPRRKRRHRRVSP